jgi:hypothetical protein
VTGTLLTTIEVAERLGLSSAAVAQAVRTGALQPAARTSDDFLFTERSVAAFAERRAEAAATPLAPPKPGNRSDWSGDVGRLNTWLKELTESLPPGAPDPRPPTAPAPPPIVAKSLLERIAASQPAPIPPLEPEPKPKPEPAPVVWPDPEPEAAVEPAPVGAPEPAPEPPPEVAAEPEPRPAVALEAAETVVTPVVEVRAPVSAPSSDLSRQAVLVVRPVVRFRVLRDVADRLATVPGLSDARLERLEGGVASYRVSFAGERPTPEAIGGPLADLNLEVILVEPSL